MFVLIASYIILQNYEINPPVNVFPKFTLFDCVPAVFTISIKNIDMGLHVDSMHTHIRPDIGLFTKATALPHLVSCRTTWSVGTVDIVDIGFSPTLPPFLI